MDTLCIGHQTDFFQELATAKQRILVIDCDDFGPESCIATRSGIPYPSIPELLDCIMSTCQTRVVLVSRADKQEAFWAPQPGPQPQVLRAGPERQPWLFESGVNAKSDFLAMTFSEGDDALAVYVCAHGTGSVLDDAGEVSISYLSPSAPQTDGNATLVSVPEKFRQFLIDWLRTCSGEMC
jgi:hypothetical protein